MRNFIIGVAAIILAACASVPPATQLFNSCNTAYSGLNSLYVFNDRMSGETKGYIRVVRNSIDAICIHEEFVSIEAAIQNVQDLILVLLEEERKAKNAGG